MMSLITRVSQLDVNASMNMDGRISAASRDVDYFSNGASHQERRSSTYLSPDRRNHQLD